MGFSEVGGQVKYVKYTEMTAGQVVAEGWFTETRQNKFNVGKEDYFVVDADGVTHCMNNAGHLAFLMKSVMPEDYIRVTFMGKEKITKGPKAGTDANRFKLEMDKSRHGLRNKAGFAEVAPVEEIKASDDSLPF